MVALSAAHKISRVAVIGGGPTGLAAARALRDQGAFSKITVFERNAEVGGTWLFSPQANPSLDIPSVNALDIEPPGIYYPPKKASMYANLRTNLPHAVMCFRDLPFEPGTPMFPTHEQVLKYLKSVADSCQLQPMIRLNTSVLDAEFLDSESVWRLSLVEVGKEGRKYTEEYDAVVVASGHYTVPHIPAIDGIVHASKKLRIMHSRDYRYPDAYRDQNLVVIGGGPSARDIVRETSSYAKRIYHSMRTEDGALLSAQGSSLPNVQSTTVLTRFNEDGSIECQNGTILKDVDTIIFATGFLYSFPFLRFEKDLIVDGQNVQNLYKYLFYIKNPTLAFVGLPIRTVPLPFAQSQSMVIARCWSGHATIPSREAMFEEEGARRLSNDRSNIILGADKEFALVDRMNAWAEGWPLDKDLAGWQSTDIVTGRLPEWWKSMRKAAPQLRLEQLGH
ncbi:uncharacterized protein BYT42DRAFT_610980 [Radiomyces spectabilis]|uniref:uncharacterized protein n=1 Tax=Radiomyces spectabilis TaxID=64574 RepID=UPI00221F3204|nr:uncharacterized protein BYT42DRAFT_610980 [Radiomyces spectabilis]KAI8391792.1 hypothetical protein BYT42DRAFT_610980 [Radiomyces spectabilis]